MAGKKDKGKDKEEISDEISRRVEEGMGGMPDYPQHNCTSAKFDCGDYTCVNDHSCSHVYTNKA